MEANSLREEELIVFGEHNVRAEGLTIGRLVAHFDWADYFAAVGIIGTYPAILYTHEEADVLYESVTALLGGWIAAADPTIDFSLLFEDGADGKPVGDLEIVLTTQWNDADAAPSRLSMYRLGCRLLKAGATWLAEQEAYGSRVVCDEKEISRQPSGEGLRLTGRWTLRVEESEA